MWRCLQIVRCHRSLDVTSLVVLTLLTSHGMCDVFTSISKIAQLSDTEGVMLDGVNQYISDQYDNLKALSTFLSERSKVTRLKLEGLDEEQDFKKLAEHPNGAYLLIKNFYDRWSDLQNKNPGLESYLMRQDVPFPQVHDRDGALSSLVRLQRVYQLSVRSMYAGDYGGHQGPPLTPQDALLIGRQAFIDGYIPAALPWLHMAVDLLQSEAGASGNKSGEDEFQSNLSANQSVSRAVSLLGRCYYFMKNETKAWELYNWSFPLEPEGGDVKQLKVELDSKGRSKYGHMEKDWEETHGELCRRNKDHRVNRTRPWHVCRYKAAQGLPYLRYKEEVLSLAPAVSLFYEVVHDGEIDDIKAFIQGKMFRGLVGSGKNAVINDMRTSDLAWINDWSLQSASAVSQRVTLMTGLETNQREPLGPSSAEPMQVVNYGMGGHYSIHTDPFDKPLKGNQLLEFAGNRIATFLIYLGDVELGGNTVFTKSGISVSPVKGMALFWYNFTPALENDILTTHAGCPVVIGQKWIANKWIWTHGNTFRRPCGPAPDTRQHELEELQHASSRRSPQAACPERSGSQCV